MSEMPKELMWGQPPSAVQSSAARRFLSDMFSPRLYKLAASRVGVPDYNDLVQEKLRTAEELYRFMVDEFNQSRVLRFGTSGRDHPDHRAHLLFPRQADLKVREDAILFLLTVLHLAERFHGFCKASLVWANVNVRDSCGMLVINGRTSHPNPGGMPRVREMASSCM